MKDKFVSLVFSSLNSNHGQKALFFSHFQIVTYVCCTQIWTSSTRKKTKLVFFTAYERCEINLNNVLSSTLVFFSSSLVTLYNHKRKESNFEKEEL